MACHNRDPFLVIAVSCTALWDFSVLYLENVLDFIKFKNMTLRYAFVIMFSFWESEFLSFYEYHSLASLYSQQKDFHESAPFLTILYTFHDDVTKWKHFPRYWPFVRRIHRSQVNSPHKGQWRGALMFSLICAGINAWVNNGEACDLRHHRANYDITVLCQIILIIA